MSRVFAAYSAGGLIGPALGAFGGIRGPFLAYLAMLLLAMPLVLFVKPAVRRDLTGDRAVLRTRAFWIASGAILFASLALGVLEGVLPLHLAERVTQAQIGALYVGAVACGCDQRDSFGRAAAAPARDRGRRAQRGRHRARRHRHGRAALGAGAVTRSARDRVWGTPARSACSSRRCLSSGS